MLSLRLVPVFALLAASALAGCTNGGSGQEVTYEGSLAYNGTSAGTHQATADCSSSGSLNWSVNLAMGDVDLTVRDGAGKTVFSESMSGTSQTAFTKPVAGAEGQWTISVKRTASSQYGQSMWSGQYAAFLDC